MFFLAVTHERIRDRFQGIDGDIHETTVGPLVVTAVTDNFLSHLSFDADGFSLVESPGYDRDCTDRLVLTETVLDTKAGRLSLFKPIHSARPLYYRSTANSAFYCSTSVAMLRRAGLTVQANTEVLPEFFIYRYVTAPNTLYKDIRQVCNGSHLRVAMVDDRCVLLPEEKYDPFEDESCDVAEYRSLGGAVTKVREILGRSMDALTPCGSRISVMLSGGLDSSILYAMSRELFGTTRSYSTSYPFEKRGEDRERQYAASAAAALRSDHHYYEADVPTYLYGLLESVSAAEEPLHHLQSVMIHLLLRHGIPAEENVVLSGGGADGAFGLPLHNDVHAWETHAAYRFLSRRPLLSLATAASSVTGRGRGFVRRASGLSKHRHKRLDDPSHLVYSLGEYGSHEWVRDYFHASRDEVVRSKYECVKPFGTRSIYDLITILDFFGDVPITESIWSKIAEDAGKVLCWPFCSSEMLSGSLAIDWQTKLRHPKQILREVARELGIADFIIERPKLGFGVSADRWAKPGGVFEPLVPLAAKCFELEVIRETQTDDPRRAMTFWNILNYSIWKRLCVDCEPLDGLREELSRSLRDGRRGQVS